MEKDDEDLKEMLIEKEPYMIRGNDDDYKIDSESEPLSESEKRLIETINSHMKNEYFEWNNSQVNDYKFTLPKTAFSDAKQLELLKYEDAEVDYADNENEKLSDDQINEIATNGEFSVKSKKGKVYVWKVSTWLMQGNENRFKNFQEDLGYAFEFFYYYKYRFNSKFYYANIYRVAKNCYFFVRDIWRLIFGSTFFYSKNDTFYDKLHKEYYERILPNSNISTRIYFPNARTIFASIYSKFSTEWDNTRYIVEDELRSKELPEEEQKHKLLETRLDRLIEFFKDQLDSQINSKVSSEMKATLLMLIKAKHIVVQVEHNHLDRVDLMKKQLMERLLAENPIKSKTKPWLNKVYFTEEKERIIELEKERNREREESLKDYPIALYLVNVYDEFERQSPVMAKALNEHEPDNPRQTFYYDFTLCTPRVEESKYEYNGITTISYIMKYSKQLTTSTSYYFWRQVRSVYLLIWMFWEVLVWWKKMLFNTSFGIKALFCSKVESSRYLLNSVNGEIGYSYTDYTYPSSFSKLSDWITESRESFLRNRHTNFFGSNFGNIVNIIENYFIKAFILGTLMAIFYPIGIILFSLLCSILMLAGIFLSVVFVIVAYLFNIIIFDTWSPTHNGCPIIPLVVIFVWRAVICVAFSTLAFLVLCIVQLLGIIFMLIWALLSIFVRFFYDKLMIMIIKCLAKIPRTDSSVAWKIRGPGLNRTQFTKISIDDSLTLLRSKLEKIQLNDYNERLQKVIDIPIQNINKFNTRVMKKANCTIQLSDRISKNVGTLRNTLYNQYYARQRIYPNECTNIRFSQEDLEVFLIASQDLIKDFVETEKLNFIWKMYAVVEGKWDLLTEKIVKETFGEGILENIDEGVEMLELKQNDINIINEIEQVQRNANIVNYHSMAFRKREKLAKKHDFENAEELEISQKYLAARKHTSKGKFDDVNQRMVTIDFLSYEGVFYFASYLLPEQRYKEETILDNKLSPNYKEEKEENN